MDLCRREASAGDWNTFYSWPAKEVLDNGLICLERKGGGAWSGLLWAEANHIMANATHPCIHSESSYPEINPGQTVTCTGALYCSEKGIEDILKQTDTDLTSGRISQTVSDGENRPGKGISVYI